jgi:hypothetical protein
MRKKKEELFLPFGGIVLVKFDGISIIFGEFVMEIVVSFSQSQNGCDEGILGGMSISKSIISQSVSQAIHKESGVMDEAKSDDSSPEERADPVTPAKTSNNSWEDEGHDHSHRKIILVLELNHRIRDQVRHIDLSSFFVRLFQ